MRPLFLAFGDIGISSSEAHTNRTFLSVNFAQWVSEVFLQIISQRPQRRDVKTMNTFTECALFVLSRQLVQDVEESSKGLTSACRGDDQYMFARLDQRPGSILCRGRFFVSLEEPLPHWR